MVPVADFTVPDAGPAAAGPAAASRAVTTNAGRRGSLLAEILRRPPAFRRASADFGDPGVVIDAEEIEMHRRARRLRRRRAQRRRQRVLRPLADLDVEAHRDVLVVVLGPAGRVEPGENLTVVERDGAPAADRA